MASKILGIGINIDTSSAITGLAQLNRRVKAVQSDIKATSTATADWGTKVEHLEKEIKSSTTIMNEQLKYYRLMETELTKMIAKGEASEEQILAQKTKLNQAAIAYNKTADQIKKLNEQLEELKDNAEFNLDELSSELQLANARFEEAAAGTKDLNNDLEAQKLKIDALNKKWSLSKAELASLEKQLKSQGEANDENRSTINRLKSAIIQKRVEVAKDKAAVEKQKDATDKLSLKIKEQSSIFGKLKKALKNTTMAMGDAEKGVQILEGGFTVLKGVIVHFMSSTLRSLFGTLRYLLSSARELRKELGMIKATGVAMNFNQEELAHAEETLKRVYTITEDAVGGTEAINNLLTAGFKTDKLDEVTEYLLGASIKWKDTLNMEGMSDSIQEAIGSKGLSVTGQFAELLERTGHNLDNWKKKFSRLTTDAERQDMIMKALAKGGLKDTLKAYENINNTLIAENKTVFDTLHQSAKFAEFLTPMILKTKELGNAIMLTIMQFFGYDKELGEFTKEGQEKIQTIIDKLDVLKNKIVGVFKWVLDNLPIVTAAIGTVATTIFANKAASISLGIMENYTSAIASLGKTSLTAADKFGALSKAMTGGKFGLIAIAIAAVVAGLIALYKNNEEFRNSVNKLWESIKPTLEILWEAIKSLLPPLMDLLKRVGDLLISTINAILPILIPVVDLLIKILVPAIKNLIGWLEIIISVVKFVVDAIVLKIQFFVNYWKAIWESLKAIFSGDIGKLGEIWSNFGKKLLDGVKNLFSGLFNGFGEGFKKIFESWKNWWNSLIEWFKNLFGIHSPSTVFADFGKNIIQGLLNGIQSFYENIKNSVNSIADFFTDLPSKIWDKIKGIADKIKDAFLAAVDKVKNIGKDIVEGLWEGINNKTNWLKNKITEFADKAGEAITDFFRIKAPSKRAIKQGGYIGEGLGIGVVNSSKGVRNNINSFNKKLLDDSTNGIANVPNNKSTNIDARMTVNYNGNLSRKQLKQLENDNYSAIKMRLISEGAI